MTIFINNDVDQIENKLGVEIIASTLYGSHTRGYGLENSDHDLAIIYTTGMHTAGDKSILALKENIRFEHYSEDTKHNYDVFGMELFHFARHVANGDPHCTLMLWGQPVDKTSLLQTMRRAVIDEPEGRKMVVHKMAQAVRGLLKKHEASVRPAQTKAHMTAAYMFLSAVARSQPKFDCYPPVVFQQFGTYMRDSGIPADVHIRLAAHLGNYINDLLKGNRYPLTPASVRALNLACEQLIDRNHYDIPTSSVDREVKVFKGDENNATVAMAAALMINGYL